MRTIIFDVDYLGQCGCGVAGVVTRRIEVSEFNSLDNFKLCLIDDSFGWDDPHLYAFYFDNKPYSDNPETTYLCEDNAVDAMWVGLFKSVPDDCYSTKTLFGALQWRKGKRFLFVYDFGDDHRFSVKVSGFGEFDRDKPYPLLLDATGDVPQYPVEGVDGVASIMTLNGFKCDKCLQEFEGNLDAKKFHKCINCGGRLVFTGSFVAKFDVDGRRIDDDGVDK